MGEKGKFRIPPTDTDMSSLPPSSTEEVADKDGIPNKDPMSNTDVKPEKDGDTTTKVVKVNRIITVEPIIMLSNLFISPIGFIASNYINRRVTDDLLQEGFANVTNVTYTSPCNSSEDDPMFLFGSEVQSRVAYFNMFQTLAGTIPSLFMTLFLGAYSDKTGRKYAIIPPLIGYQMLAVVCVIVSWTGWPKEYLLIGNFLTGISGGYYSLSVGCYTYIADVTSPANRAFRLSVMEVSIYVSLVAMFAGLGYLIQALDFFWPFLISFLGLSLLVIYGVFFIPETVEKDTSAKFFTFDHLRASAKVISKKSSHGRRWKLGLLQVAFFLNCIPYFGSQINTIFLLNRPMCWSPSKLGLYNAGFYGAIFVGSAIGAKLFKSYIPDYWAVMITGLSCLAQAMAQSFITNDLWLYVVPLTATFGGILIPITRALMSKLVLSREQGSLFALLACEEMVSSTVGNVIFNPIYAATAPYWPGFVFFVGGIFYVLAMILFLIYALVAGKKDEMRHQAAMAESKDEKDQLAESDPSEEIPEKLKEFDDDINVIKF